MAMTKKIPDTIKGANTFCPGCGHGVVVRLIAEALEELGHADDAICAVAVGCSCLVNVALGIDKIGCPHGRASACAAGIKRVRPGNLVFSYQGDGDSLSIGLAETVYSAQRNEKFTQIIVNNGVFGMTGGQASPCTLIGQKTTTTVDGRSVNMSGVPLDIMKMFGQIESVAYLARGSVHDAQNILNTKRYIKKAFEAQMAGAGFSCVEILSPCPTNWHMEPVDSMERIAGVVSAYYPIGEIVTGGGLNA
ncbi:MAG: 2-oxoglutarate oxidoreductase [Clostridiales Family XIII bacterium]|jgi:2-oxoglutarate ferredoxin oxidoreductase subunit beta|nr:2-oxoglutarate oxidoreductase [Clostridiales Family XIII bacterium]